MVQLFRYLLSALVFALFFMNTSLAIAPTYLLPKVKVKKPKYIAHPPPQPTSRNEGLLDVGQDFIITAYTAGVESTGKHPGDKGYGIAADGNPIKVGDCAADSKYPFGTKFVIDSYGTVVVTDRGGAITGNRIDIYMPNLRQALQFGKQIHKVRVIYP